MESWKMGIRKVSMDNPWYSMKHSLFFSKDQYYYIFILLYYDIILLYLVLQTFITDLIQLVLLFTEIYIWCHQGYQKMLDKLNLRRKKAVKVQKSVSSDKRVDYHEWHKDLKRSVYMLSFALLSFCLIYLFILWLVLIFF